MLEITDLNVAYIRARPPVQALHEVAFTMAAGENLGIIGESGCGKTTLALAIMGLLSEAQVRGRIDFDGQPLTGMGQRALRRIRWKRIAMVFQNALEVFNPVITVGEQMTEPLTTHAGLSRAEADARACELLELTGLCADVRFSFAHQLSGGMRQRVLIAMALVCRPELLIVDEPFTALDPQSRTNLIGLLKELQKGLGFAMLLITHSLSAVRQLTSRLITLYAGRIVEQGLTAEILKIPLHPYTRGLIDCAPEFFPYKDLWGIAGEPPSAAKTAGCPFQPRCNQSTSQCARKLPALRYVAVERKVACHRGGVLTVLQARGIRKTYHVQNKAIRALDGVDFFLRSGEVAALVGISGSGKSTLAHILTHVLLPDEGEVLFFDRPMREREATRRMGGLQIVFQDPAESVSHRLTVLEAVREPLDIMGWQDRKTRDEKAIAALSAVHLSIQADFINRTCHALSGGQRQRVAIARALTTDPRVLIADEITALLDPSTQATLLRELKGLQNRTGFAMLFITHDIHLSRKVADRVWVLDQGRIVEQGAAFEVFERPEHDQCRRLLDAALGSGDSRMI
jgi:peptide/nickel transport system ATP-binding protein